MADDWTEILSPEERVRTIAETMSGSRRIGWVAEQAEVDEATARAVLDAMVDEGVLATWEADPEGCVYTVNEGRHLMDRLRDLGEVTDDGGIHIPPDVVDEMETARPGVDGTNEE